VQPQSASKVRRQQWTDVENSRFEQWITKNPKPNAQQKRDFAES
jgi:hypothetical protein